MKLVPPRILVFCWLALLQIFLTLDKLETRKHIIVNGCPLCLTDEETVNHLLIHSSFATRIWSSVLYRFGVQWVMPRIISELFQQWKITCNILSETTVFLYKSADADEVFDSIVWTISGWANHDEDFDDVSLQDLHLSGWASCDEDFDDTSLHDLHLGGLFLTGWDSEACQSDFMVAPAWCSKAEFRWEFHKR